MDEERYNLTARVGLLLVTCAVALMVGKLTEVAAMSWWVVTAPLWVPIVFFVVVVACVAIGSIFFDVFGDRG